MQIHKEVTVIGFKKLILCVCENYVYSCDCGVKLFVHCVSKSLTLLDHSSNYGYLLFLQHYNIATIAK